MPDMTSTVDSDSRGATLNSAPPAPPKSRQGQSVMDLASGSQDDQGLGSESGNPIIQIMMAMGESKNALLKLSAHLPALGPGIMQFIQGMEQVIPQMMAELVSGQTPGMAEGASPLSNQAPTAPTAQQAAS